MKSHEEKVRLTIAKSSYDAGWRRPVPVKGYDFAIEEAVLERGFLIHTLCMEYKRQEVIYSMIIFCFKLFIKKADTVNAGLT